MEPGRIKELLNKYWEGETTLDEEAELKKYFTNKNAVSENPADLLFQYLQEEQTVSLPDSFDERVQQSIVTDKKPVRWLYPLIKIVAALLITFSVIYFLVPNRKPQTVAFIETDTYDDPQRAYIETRKALLLISNHLNAGKDYIDEVGKINKAEELIHSKTN